MVDALGNIAESLRASVAINVGINTSLPPKYSSNAEILLQDINRVFHVASAKHDVVTWYLEFVAFLTMSLSAAFPKSCLLIFAEFGWEIRLATENILLHFESRPRKKWKFSISISKTKQIRGIPSDVCIDLLESPYCSTKIIVTFKWL